MTAVHGTATRRLRIAIIICGERGIVGWEIGELGSGIEKLRWIQMLGGEERWFEKGRGE